MTGNKMCKERGRYIKNKGLSSRQPLTNFINLKSNTIMKKPQYKNTLAKLVCQAFYG